MNTLNQRAASVIGALAGLGVIAGAEAQVCDEVEAIVLNRTYPIERNVDAVRYVHEAILRDNAFGDYIFEFSAKRIDLPKVMERWTVTFEDVDGFDYVRHLDIDAGWAHTFRSWTVNGTRYVSIETPHASAQLTPDNALGTPEFDAFVALVDQTSAHREVVTGIIDDMPPWDHPELDCVHDCVTLTDMCGIIPDCSAGMSPTACECWASFECCMSNYVDWYVCTSECICALCWDDWVESCCAVMPAERRDAQFYCEQEFLDCLRSPNLQPCAQQ